MKLNIDTHIDIYKTTNIAIVPKDFVRRRDASDSSPRRYSRFGGARICAAYNELRISGAEQSNLTGNPLVHTFILSTATCIPIYRVSS